MALRETAGPSDAIVTKRLVIAPLALDHVDALLAYHVRNEQHLASWEPARSPDFFTRSYWSSYTTAVMDDAYSGRAHRFVATLRSSPQIIASINVTNIVHGVFQAGVLGYSVDFAHQARGYGKEAVGAVVDWCFGALKMHRIEANYQPTNERSGRLLRALGFTVEGYARDYLYIDGAWRDHILTSKTHAIAPGKTRSTA